MESPSPADLPGTETKSRIFARPRLPQLRLRTSQDVQLPLTASRLAGLNKLTQPSKAASRNTEGQEARLSVASHYNQSHGQRLYGLTSIIDNGHVYHTAPGLRV